MDKGKLPSAPAVARPSARGAISDKAIKAWTPDIQAAGDAERSISILDPIGADFFGDGVTAKRIAAALRSIGDADAIVNINSPGGDFFEGLAIYNLLREHKGKVTVNVLGLAASAAAVIAMAGDEVRIAKAGFLMIHNTWVLAAGDRHAFTDVAEWLKPFDEAQVAIFGARTGINAKKLGDMLDRETWLNGDKAKELGFADALLEADEVSGSTRAEGDLSPLAATKKIELSLAKSSLSRTERSELIAALKGGAREAAPNGKRDAAAMAGLRKLSEKLKQL